MKIDFLLEKLKKSGIKMTCSVIENADIYSVELYSKHYMTKRDTLYILTGTKQDKDNNLLKECCCIYARDIQEAEKLLKITALMLKEDYKKTRLLLKLERGMAEKPDICALNDLVSEIIGSRIYFVNDSLNIICKYQRSGISKERADNIAKAVDAWRNRAPEHRQSDSSRDVIIRRIFYRDKGYYICTKNSQGFGRYEFSLLDEICLVFNSDFKEKPAISENDEIKMILEGLIRGSFEYPEREKDRLIRLGFKSSEKYYLIVMDSIVKLEKNVYAEMEDLIKAEFLKIENYSVILINSDKYTEYTEQRFPQLNRLLFNKGINGALSFGFSDIGFSNVRFEQCRALLNLEVAANEKRPGLRYCGRYQIGLLMQILNRDKRIDLRNFCSPIILTIYDIDKKQNTEYMDTLFTFICSGQSVKASAEALKIHVNTMYTRINKLKDMFKIDFQDEHMLYTLHNSIVLLTLWDNSTIKDGYPYLKKN